MKIKAAGKYFSYIAKHFPVMCASGSFPMFPPVAEAANHLARLDDLSAKNVAKHIAKLTRFKRDFDAAETKANTPLEQAAVRALSISAACALTELDQVQTWKRSPALYLQVAFTGLEQCASMPAKSAKEREKRFLKRVKAVPGFLALAPANIEAISPTSRALAQTMIRDCARHLTRLGETEPGASGKIPRYLADCMTALREFDRFVASRPEIPESEGPSFRHMCDNVVGTTKSAQEIFQIAQAEFDRRSRELGQLEDQLGTSWREALAAYTGPGGDDMEAMDLVIREIHRLRGFVFESGLPSVFSDSGLRIVPPTPHLASTQRPIHYEPALGGWQDEQSYCFVSAQIFSGRGFRDDSTRLARMRREFLFMAARQTYPGRHLMDTQRRTLGDSPMAQITNPLFTAGWLAFAEDILNERGYLETPQDKMVHHQRCLARAALAMIDAGLAVGNLDQDGCLAILKDAGFSTDESLDRVRAIRLEPASRVMPVLGLHELRSMQSDSGLELDEFCRRLFTNGQLPLDHLPAIIAGL